MISLIRALNIMKSLATKIQDLVTENHQTSVSEYKGNESKWGYTHVYKLLVSILRRKFFQIHLYIKCNLHQNPSKYFGENDKLILILIWKC